MSTPSLSPAAQRDPGLFGCPFFLSASVWMSGVSQMSPSLYSICLRAVMLLLRAHHCGSSPRYSTQVSEELLAREEPVFIFYSSMAKVIMPGSQHDHTPAYYSEVEYHHYRKALVRNPDKVGYQGTWNSMTRGSALILPLWHPGLRIP